MQQGFNASPSPVHFGILILLAISLLPPKLCAAPTRSAFDAGVAAAKEGDYRQAVSYFRRAAERGEETPALYYNLGVAYYKLGRYDQARSAFQKAAQTKSMRALSHYNIGLVEQAAGNEAAAEAWFRQAYEGARTAKLRRLAAMQLHIEPAPLAPYQLYAEAFSGYDSNPQLAGDDDPLNPTGEREGGAEIGLLGAGRYLLGGDWSDGFAGYGSVYVSHYPNLDGEDFVSASAGGALYDRVGAWDYRYQVGIDHLRLGGETLTDGVRAGVRGRRHLTETLQMGLRARTEYLDGGNGFGYLTGWRFDARARLAGGAGAWRWRAHYAFEYNDREDFDADGDFFSVSPIRHELGARLERRLVGRLQGEAELAYRISRYRDAEIRNSAAAGEREDDRLFAGMGLSHPLGGRWTARVEADYWRNDSNFARFDYERTELLLSIGRSFP